MTEPDTRTGFNLFRQETQGKGAQALSREPLAKIGARFAGRYHITEELGRGAMGVVYRAADLRGDGYVAIKVVPLGEDEATARFVRGTKIMLRLKHSALCRALASGRSEVSSHVIMEDLPGCSLAAVLSPGTRVPWERAARWIAELCEGLALMHAQGFVHRDVKTGNLVLRGAGDRASLVLIDFDLAKPYSPPLLQDSGRIPRTTLLQLSLGAKKALSGTPVYMTAERLRGEPATPDADLFATALVLYRLIVGSLPTTQVDHLSLERLIDARRRALPRLGPGVPPPLKRILQRALARRRGERYRSALELGRDLREVLEAAARPTGPMSVATV